MRFRELVKLVWGRAANGAVEAPLPLCFTDHIPQGNPTGSQPSQPLLVLHLRQPLANGLTDQPPELVLRMGVIALAFSDASPGRLPRMSSLASCEPTGSIERLTMIGTSSGCSGRAPAAKAKRNEARRAPHRPVLGQLQLCSRRRQPSAEPAGRLPASAGRAGSRLFADGEAPCFPGNRRHGQDQGVQGPRQGKYRIPYKLPHAARRDLDEFAPDLVHVSSPDFVAHRAISWARRRQIPVVASVHTRFDTYLQYYGLKWLEPAARAIIRRFYRRCDAIVVPAESTAAIMRAQRMNKDISIWSRGVDRLQFNPERRSLEWRRAHGIGDEEMVVSFLGRLVLEKGLDVFADAVDAARAKGVPLKIVTIGDGPARDYFKERLPDAIFTGQLTGDDLATALASTDVFLNPSVTETSAMSRWKQWPAVPVLAAAASGTTSLVKDGVTGRL